VTTGEAVQTQLWHENPNTRNTIANPNAVMPQQTTLSATGDRFELEVPPHSYTILDIPLAS
jgi:alpha-L-arabinofuranosidase